MIPFDSYPERGQILLGKLTGANCRHEYGLKLQRLTGQTMCAYCHINLIDDYYHWLLLSVDHVIPKGEAQRLNIPPRLFDDAINAVLCCIGCNQLGNRVRLPFEPRSHWDLQAFVGLRNDAFTYRFEVIAMLRAKELQFFHSRP